MQRTLGFVDSLCVMQHESDIPDITSLFSPINELNGITWLFFYRICFSALALLNT